MKSRRQEIDDERDTSLGLPDSYFDDLKPGFKPAEKNRKAETEGHGRLASLRFPRVAEEGDVPRAPLAERIARRR